MATVVPSVDQQDGILRVHGIRHLRSFDRLELWFTVIEDHQGSIVPRDGGRLGNARIEDGFFGFNRARDKGSRVADVRLWGDFGEI
jgi:hypothetical protein